MSRKKKGKKAQDQATKTLGDLVKAADTLGAELHVRLSPKPPKVAASSRSMDVDAITAVKSPPSMDGGKDPLVGFLVEAIRVEVAGLRMKPGATAELVLSGRSASRLKAPWLPIEGALGKEVLLYAADEGGDEWVMACMDTGQGHRASCYVVLAPRFVDARAIACAYFEVEPSQVDLRILDRGVMPSWSRKIWRGAGNTIESA